MTAQACYGVTFEGYWRDENERSLPSWSGIYCVYICVDHPTTNEVLLNELIYIGEADDVKARIAEHERHSAWQACLKPGEDLCYSYAHVPPGERSRCVAALIFNHQPRENDEYRHSFPFDTTTISLSGCIARLHANFTVKRSTEHAGTV